MKGSGPSLACENTEPRAPHVLQRSQDVLRRAVDAFAHDEDHDDACTEMRPHIPAVPRERRRTLQTCTFPTLPRTFNAKTCNARTHNPQRTNALTLGAKRINAPTPSGRFLPERDCFPPPPAATTYQTQTAGAVALVGPPRLHRPEGSVCPVRWTRSRSSRGRPALHPLFES